MTRLAGGGVGAGETASWTVQAGEVGGLSIVELYWTGILTLPRSAVYQIVVLGWSGQTGGTVGVDLTAVFARRSAGHADQWVTGGSVARQTVRGTSVATEGEVGVAGIALSVGCPITGGTVRMTGLTGVRTST